MKLKDRVFDFVVSKGDNVSFAEFSKELDGFKGNFEFDRPDKNVVFWQGASKEFIDAINELVYEDKLLEFKGTTTLVYLSDGLMPRLPLAKQDRVYRETHWVPVVMKLTKSGEKRGEQNIKDGKHPYDNSKYLGE